MEITRTPEQYAEIIYRNFCEDDWSNDALGVAWMNYQEKHGAINVGDEVDKITQAAILHTIKAFITILQDEAYDRRPRFILAPMPPALALDPPPLPIADHTPPSPNL